MNEIVIFVAGFMVGMCAVAGILVFVDSPDKANPQEQDDAHISAKYYVSKYTGDKE